VLVDASADFVEPLTFTNIKVIIARLFYERDYSECFIVDFECFIISECFIVMFVEQPSCDYLDICEDKWLNKMSASINKHRIILLRIK